ncbi:MAG: ATP-binding cassette domain-containing protein, partial [Bradyrhizobium sp.]|nr:ATP-binding cassette domain-containing protein [Bradyrhizobium sp.]
MTAGIRVQDLAKAYDARPVFRGLSLDVAPGEFVALLGPSGAGKTTLLRCMTRSLDADRGQIWLAGHAMHELRNGALASARRDIGFVFQQFNLVQRRSALENALAG